MKGTNPMTIDKVKETLCDLITSYANQLGNTQTPMDKWLIAAWDNLARKQGTTPIASGTYETVGVHFQGNPYKLEGDTLWRHGTQFVDVERTFEGVRDWLTRVNDEGLVFWLNGEPVCKIKRSDFGLEWGGAKK